MTCYAVFMAYKAQPKSSGLIDVIVVEADSPGGAMRNAFDFHVRRAKACGRKVSKHGKMLPFDAGELLELAERCLHGQVTECPPEVVA